MSSAAQSQLPFKAARYYSTIELALVLEDEDAPIALNLYGI